MQSPPPRFRNLNNHDSNIIIREVWDSNLEHEFHLIARIIHKFPFVSMDTEYPGVIYPYNGNYRNLESTDNYWLLKQNVDALNIIQVGLTFSDKDGNLPDLGTKREKGFIWQFNFCDFNLWRDLHARDSIELLMDHGINFAHHAVAGVSSYRFAIFAARAGLVLREGLTWLTFHGAYDFGFLVKIMMQQALPARLEDFLRIVSRLFGDKIYDMKHMMGFCNGLHGGLERVAQTLNVQRVAGRHHHAGSDSLLTMHAFQKMKETYFSQDEHETHANVLFGLNTREVRMIN